MYKHLKVRNGLIIQWGKLNVSSGELASIKFNTAAKFSTIPTVLWVPVKFNATSITWVENFGSIINLSVNGFEVDTTPGNPSKFGIHWFAIGK